MAINISPVPIYQFRVVLKDTSPHIWRRLLVHSQCSLAEFHGIIQTAMEWAGTYTSQLTIRGRKYEMSRGRDVKRPDNCGRIRLINFGFREKERFTYEYRWGSPWAEAYLWRCDIRMERGLPPCSENDQKNPRCIRGVGIAPPEDCEGPRAFAEFRDLFSPDYFVHRLEEMRSEGNMEQYQEEMRDLEPWRRDHFDRRAINRKLQQIMENQAANRGERR
jgi:hypothetical protein